MTKRQKPARYSKRGIFVVAVPLVFWLMFQGTLVQGAPSKAAESPAFARDESEAAPVPAGGAADPEQRRRDGHMTPEERHLLRQHIENAVRNLYKH